MENSESCWKSLKQNYKLLQILGEGSGGKVVRAQIRSSKKIVAIKKIPCSFKNMNQMKYVLREISILR